VECFAQLFVCRFGSCLIKKPDFGTPKMENALFVGRKKFGLHGVPRHHKGHARVWYGLVLTNYAMQPRTWQVIFVKGLSDKLFLLRFEFFFSTSR
jgi:hypothetical protein